MSKLDNHKVIFILLICFKYVQDQDKNVYEIFLIQFVSREIFFCHACTESYVIDCGLSVRKRSPFSLHNQTLK